MFYRGSVLILCMFLAACASKETLVQDVGSLPPTAAGEVGAELKFWSDITGKSVRTLTRHSKYPNDFTASEPVVEVDYFDSKGDKYGQRISGLLEVPETGDYEFWVSADESAEVWVSSDERPINKRLVALVNKPSGYKVFDRYNSQKSAPLNLEQGMRYFVEIFHKDNTGEDYLNVSWSGPGFELATLSSQNLKAYQQEMVGETVYQEGYHIGYQSGRHLSEYDLTYPALDTDGDGLPDFYESILGYDINDPSDAQTDADEDLLTALEEYLLQTNPVDSDSDGDGLPDGYELVYGLSATDPNDAWLDMDGDGVSNIDEYIAGSLLDDGNDVPVVIVDPQVTLNWVVPTLWDDGNALLFGDIQSYKIYAGESVGGLSLNMTVNDPAATSAVLTGLTEATTYFAISTVTTDGIEGVRSSVINILDASVSEPGGGDPVVSEPIVTDPVVSEPVKTDPIVSEPVVTDPVVSEPVVTDPVVSEPVVTGPVVSEPVVIDPVVSQPVAEIILDNGDPGTSYTGTWSNYTGAERYNDSALWATAGGSIQTYRFTPTITQAGTYEVFAWNSCYSNRAINVPHTIQYAGGTNTVSVDQDCDTGTHGEWFSLGRYEFNAGDAGYLEIHDSGLNPESTTYLGADAARFISIGATSAPVVAETQYTATLSWVVPTQREDGSELLLDDIQVYKVYTGQSAVSLSLYSVVNDPATLSMMVEGLSAGLNYFAISTVTNDGMEGGRSPVLSVTF